jgi:hypothetical protein
MKRVIAVLGSSALGNIIVAIGVLYAMADYYGWGISHEALVRAVTSKVVGPPMPSNDYSLIVVVGILILSGIAFALIPAFFLTRVPKPTESAEKPRSDLIAIQEPDGGRVPFIKMVRGIAYPQPEMVQVMIEAGAQNDKWWFPQPTVAEITRFEWRCWSRFGDKNTVSGGTFRLCAIIPSKRIVEKIKELPTDAIRSKIMSVSLDRTIPDDKG